MKLWELLDESELHRLIGEKYVDVNQHPFADLTIYNYSKSAQFDRVWTPETKQCRGLIVNSKTSDIVARPFEKFMNLEEHAPSEIPNEPFVAYEKLDGSLGIYYQARGKDGLWFQSIATRGSFTSDQAIKAQEILRKKYATGPFHPRFTYLFEIIYPENRIVVNYGDKEDLILLAVIETETGQEVRPEFVFWSGPRAKQYRMRSSWVTPWSFKHSVPKNKEGFVLRFESGLRVKVKGEEYIRLHRLITGVSAKRIWECLERGEGLDVFLEDVPDEFYQWVKRVAGRLMQRFNEIRLDAIADADRAEALFSTRKDQAEWVFETGKCSYPHLVLFFLSGKTGPKMNKAIWRLVWDELKVDLRGEIWSRGDDTESRTASPVSGNGRVTFTRTGDA